MADDGFWAAALAEAEAADAADPLAGFRDRFRLPPGVIYLMGNSLGPAPEAALAAARVAAEREWAEGLIGSWNTAGWFALPTRLGDMIAPVIGAGPGEVVVSDTTSVNIHKALHAALGLRPDRRVIVAEAGSFPTDLYVAQGVIAGRPGLTLRLEGVDGPEIEGLIDGDVAAVLVNHVDYATGRRRDVAALTARIHAAGAVAVWDLCHSAGVMEVGLNAAGADLAIGCTYKYLNGGPGSPAFLFCASRHLAAARQPLTGWFSHARPFDFGRDYEADPGIRRFLTGTIPVLSFRALEAGLAIAAEADLAAVRAKSEALTGRFAALAEAAAAPHGARLIGPRAAAERGSHVSLAHPEGHAVMQALIARGVVGDFRAPEVMRFGFAPLFVRHADAVRAARTLEQVLAGRVWDHPRYRARAAVT
jgi:kynureninase